MKNVLYVLLLFYFGAFSQSYTLKETSGSDQTALLQNIFNSEVNTVIISTPAIINGTLIIPAGKILKFEGGKFSGKGIISGGIIEANYHAWIFDTALTVNPAGVNQYFSVRWFGAGGTGIDDYTAIQQSVSTCIKNNIRTVFLPVGNYKISKPILLYKPGGFCTLEMLGESSFWDSNIGTELRTSFTDAFAIGIQNGKGCKIRKMRITGLFTSPSSVDRKKFFNTSFENFTDGVCRDSRYSPYAAIVIDPFINLAANNLPADGGYPGQKSFYGISKTSSPTTGSTATEIEEMSISNFVVGICSSPNGVSQNAEITLINKIQFTNCKLCISGGQDQEKANDISHIYCWGGTHTIFATGLYGRERQAGNWNIDHANIAGAVVRFIYNDQHGYFPTSISHVYAESLGTWGTINSELACRLSDCHIDFELPEGAGKQILITSWGENIVYSSCNFRYYGSTAPMLIAGNAVFDHCYFSGPVNKNNFGIDSLYILKQPLKKNHILVVAIIFLAFISLIIFLSQRNKHRSTAKGR